MPTTVTALRQQANDKAQAALHDMNEHRSRTGRRSLVLEQRYEAAERVVDAVDEYERLDDLVWMEGPEALPFPRTEDRGDIFVYPGVH